MRTSVPPPGAELNWTSSVSARMTERPIPWLTSPAGGGAGMPTPSSLTRTLKRSSVTKSPTSMGPGSPP